MIRTVLFINPPSLPGTTANREATGGMGLTMPTPRAFFYPPQTIAYGVAALRAAGYVVGAVDAVGQDLTLPATLALLRAHAPDVFLVQVTPKTWDADYRFLHALGRELPHVPRVLFGTGAHFLPYEEWTAVADALLVGDAEWGVVAALDALQSGDDAPGFWRAGVRAQPAAVRIPPNPVLPRPAWDALPTDGYTFLTLWGSRGCDAMCRWCPYVVGWGRPRRSRNPEAVAEELFWLWRTFRKERHIFRDPVFAADPEWVFAFTRALRERGRPFPPWEVEDRPEHLTPEVLRAMKGAGCTQVKLGLEVVSPSLLARWQRVPDVAAGEAYVEAAARAIRTCREVNLVCHVFIVTGVGETEEELAATEAFLRKHRPHYVSVKRFTAYPGVHPIPFTPLPEEVLQRWEARLAAHRYPPKGPWWRRWRRWIP